MNKSKPYLQNQLKKWKSAVSQFISSPSDEDENTNIELDPHTYEICKQVADLQQTTVQSVVNYALEQFIVRKPTEFMSHVTLEQKEKNPLLYLEALTKRVDEQDGGGLSV